MSLVCNCLEPQHTEATQTELFLHTDEQDTRCDAWKKLVDIVELAAEDEREEFDPRSEFKSREWRQIVSLPPSISKLKHVRHLLLYGSSLVRIPPEVGEMTQLERFTPYTSYGLHWFPYEITRCRQLRESTVSTRAIYGNFKYRTPFPMLPSAADVLAPKSCSVCNMPFEDEEPLQVWISLSVATDVVPLLVHACSHHCIGKLPKPPVGYVQTPHRGGIDLEQPASE